MRPYIKVGCAPPIFNHPVTKGDLTHVQLCLGAVV